MKTRMWAAPSAIVQWRKLGLSVQTGNVAGTGPLPIMYEGRDHSQEGPTPNRFCLVYMRGGKPTLTRCVLLAKLREVLCVWYLI